MEKVDSIVISIGGMLTRIFFEPPLKKELITRYRGFLSDAEPNFEVKVFATQDQWQGQLISHQIMPKVSFQKQKTKIDFPVGNGEIDIERNVGILNTQMDISGLELEYFLRILYSIRSFFSGGLMIHAAGIVHRNYGYAFIGHSGSGKTTIAINSTGDFIMNDDLLLLFPDGKQQIMMYSTPFSNLYRNLENRKAALGKIFLLKKDTRVCVAEVGFGEALAEIIGNIPIVIENPQFLEEIMDRTASFLVRLPRYRLHFLPEPSFWKTIDFLEIKL